MGQRAVVFKSRLGCRPQARHFLAKGQGPVVSWLVRSLARRFFPGPGLPPKRQLFRAARDEEQVSVK
jgi:hypothetical protein